METLARLKSGQLAGHKALKISAGLSEFPMEILDLADSLELLVLSDNHLSWLPKEFSQLKQLKVVFFNNNAFEEFPAVLANCPNLSMVSFKSNKISTIAEGVLSPNLRWLVLTNNRIKTLPADISKLSRLQKLMLAGNQLQYLPAEMKACQSLELIRLSANQLQAMPCWLFSLPRLSWLAYAGNPFCHTEAFKQSRLRLEAALPVVDENSLQLGDVLGQGASGVIYKAAWTTEPKRAKDVAVKLFKGEITSDGLPADEMLACMAAGDHANLVSVLGRLSCQEKVGLVFSFITSDYKNLGDPPDLDTCTRDTYDPEVSFTLPVVLNIARGIASAVKHLHSQGIVHGDLYAHNILINQTGESILGDFGAASFYSRDDSTLSKALEHIESRAFGCLLEDLLDRCDRSESGADASISTMRQLQQDCTNTIPEERPLFSEICEVLSQQSAA